MSFWGCGASVADLYAIADWPEHFEHPDHKRPRAKRMHWVKLSNKLHGDGYVWLVSHKDGAAHFGVWIALVELASQCRPRGSFMQDFGVPHTLHSMSQKTRLSERLIEQALTRLAVLGWVTIQNKSSTNPARIPPTVQDSTEQEALVAGHPAYDLSVYLKESILSHSPDHKCGTNGAVDRWAPDIERAMRLDRRTPKQLTSAIDYAHRHDDGIFWRRNVLSGCALRKHFDRMAIQERTGQGRPRLDLSYVDKVTGAQAD